MTANADLNEEDRGSESPADEDEDCRGPAADEDLKAADVYRGQHKLIVCYDIHCNRRRTKVAGVLEGYGDRVQYSVFEAVLDSRNADRMKAELLDLIAEEEDSIRIYFLPPSGWKKIEILGVSKDNRPGEELYWIV